MTTPLRIAFVGLTISSSWGNGHATTYRSLLKGLAALKHDVEFFERDVPWYASSRDLPDPRFCRLHLYRDLAELDRLFKTFPAFDAVVIGSYVPEGADVIDLLAGAAAGSFCFYDIDTPVTLAKLDAGDAEYLSADQIPLFDIYLSFAGGAVLDQLQTRFGARRAAPLYCSVDETLYAPTGERPCWDLGYLGTYSSDRQPALERLLLEPARRLPDRRFVVAGPQYPEDIDWPANVERIDHLPPALHASFYSRQRFTLNVTRQAMVSAGSSPSVRLFEAAACGTPIISDRWKGLGDIFEPGRALHVADGPSDVERLLREETEEGRQAMAAEAAGVVRRDHTGTARAAELVALLRSVHDAEVRHLRRAEAL